MAKKNGNWIAGAVKHPGALRATAKRKGLLKGSGPMTAKAIGELADSADPLTRKRANLAKAFKRMGSAKKKTSGY